jgi:hypothetical protein
VRESEWRRLVTPLLPENQGWQVQGRRLAYRAPVGRFLIGVLAEGSIAKGHRYIWRLSMPLFEPSDTVDLSYSERIGGGSSTVSVDDEPAFARAVAAAIDLSASEEAEMARLADLSPGPNIRLSETAAYANTYVGDNGRALAILQAARATTADCEWVGEIKERLKRFERLLREDGRAGAVEHLDAQAVQTAQTLNLIHR